MEILVKKLSNLRGEGQSSGTNPIYQGKPGPQGAAATIEILGVETIEPTDRARVENLGDSSNAKFVFYIPKGDPGNPGDPGDDYVLTEEDKEEIAGMVGAGEVPSLRQEVDTLKDQVADLLYTPIAITALQLGTTVMEKGGRVDSVSVKWSLNKEPETQVLDGNNISSSEREATLTRSNGWTSDYKFTLRVTDERNKIATDSRTLAFLNGVYYGAIAEGTELTSAAVLTLTKKLQSSKGITFTANAGAALRIAYALPARYGTPSFKVGGFDGGFSLAATIDFTNASGYTESYNVWLSDNTGLGSTTVVVS